MWVPACRRDQGRGGLDLFADSACPAEAGDNAATWFWVEIEFAPSNRDSERARVRLTPLAALALTGDAGRGSDVLPRLNSWGRSFADTYQALNHGAHGADPGDPGRLIHGTKALVDKIRASLP